VRTCLLPRVRVLTSLLGVLLASSALAQDPRVPEAPRPAPRAYGTTAETIYNVPAPAFVVRDSDIEWDYSTPGYLFSPSTAGETFWAPVNLPTGAHLTDMVFYFEDGDSDANISASLRIYPGFTDATASVEEIALVSSSGNPGKGIASTTVDHTVANDTIFQNGMYAVVIVTESAGFTLKFKGVDLRWHRQVSPAPSQATFGDVPEDDPAFQFIEALATSEITVGCSAAPPLFCPDAPLTRRQMAVFLAKALGLHWPR
jgi:hypothetical protein